MTLARCTLATMAFLGLSTPFPSAAGPYIELAVGVSTRDIVEEGLTQEGESTLVDPATGVQKGNADSTRALAEIGWNFGERVTLYGTVGGVDLKIDEFDDFNGDFDVALGGGVNVNWYTAPSPSRLSVFTDFSALTFRAEDTISARFVFDGVAGQESISRIADEEIRWTEYTVKLGVSMVHPVLDRPYGGIRLSKVDGSDTVTFRPTPGLQNADQRKLDLEEDNNFGLFAGTTLFFDQRERAGLNLELNLIDEFAFITAFQFRF